MTFDVEHDRGRVHDMSWATQRPEPPGQPDQGDVVYVNGTFVKKLSLPPARPGRTGLVLDRVELAAGDHVVKIQRDAGDNGNVNIDYLDLGARQACAPGKMPGADDEFDGTALDLCRWSTIRNRRPPASRSPMARCASTPSPATSPVVPSTPRTSCCSRLPRTAPGRRRRR